MQPTRPSLSQRFANAADHMKSTGSSNDFRAGAFVFGLVILPFSPPNALLPMAAPTIYYGAGMTLSAVSKALTYLRPSHG